jgi:hypothetical protein
MVDFNEGFSGDARARKEVGVDCVLEVPNGTERPITNVSFSEDAETSEVQFNTGFHTDIAVTGVSYSGSFELAGRNEGVRETAWDKGQNDEQTALPEYISTMTIRAEDDSWAASFDNVLLNSRSKDIPSDDRTTDSYDFMAEKLTYTTS